MQYFIINTTWPDFFQVVTEAEFNAFKTLRLEARNYANKVLNGEISIDQVPGDYLSTVNIYLEQSQ